MMMLSRTPHSTTISFLVFAALAPFLFATTWANVDWESQIWNFAVDNGFKHITIVKNTIADGTRFTKIIKFFGCSFFSIHLRGSGARDAQCIMIHANSEDSQSDEFLFF
jgi:hypothetical protein